MTHSVPRPLQTTDLAALKAGGIVKQRQPDLFTVRVRAPMGALTAGKVRALAEAAERFGDGRLHLSVRQSPEIMGVPQDRLNELKEFLREANLEPAACGPRVRAVTGCSGCAVNPLALVDTQQIGLAVDAAFFGRPAHAKFKITFSGCPNDCTRAKCADLGFVGTLEPSADPSSCTACGLCSAVCRTAALSADEDGVPALDRERCVGCGDCVRVCPVSAMKAAHVGLAVYAGGKHGRAPRIADHVAALLPVGRVADVVAATLEWYTENGARGLRLGHVIERLGVAAYAQAVIPGDHRVAPASRRQAGGMVT